MNDSSKHWTPFSGISVDLNIFNGTELRKMSDILSTKVHIIKLTDNQVGYLIGYRGKRLRSLRKGIECDVSFDSPGSPLRTVKISGKDRNKFLATLLAEVDSVL